MLSLATGKRKVEREVHYLSSAESILFLGVAADFLGFRSNKVRMDRSMGRLGKDWALSHLEALIRYRASQKPICIFLDALQWSDDGLEGINRILKRRPPGVFMVLSSRPLPIPPRGGFAAILRAEIPHLLLPGDETRRDRFTIASRFGEKPEC